MTATDSARQVANLQAVLEVTRRLGVMTDLEKMLEVIIAESMNVLDAERASLFLFDADAGELHSRIAVGTDEIRFAVEHGIAGAAARERATINVPDAYADERFNSEVDRRTGFRTRNILACPLVGFDGQLVGVLQVLNKLGRPFDESDRALAETLAVQAGVALERARLIAELVDKHRMERELQLASSIQQRFLPQRPPHAAGFDIAGWSQPATEAGGDCFDFLELPGDRLLIVVGDATGHGLGPALVSTECRAFVRAVATFCPDVSQAIGQVNTLLCPDLPDGSFVTLFLSVLHVRESLLEFASAGHGPMLLVRPHRGEIVSLDSTGLPLGVLADSEFGPPSRIELESGDMLAVFSDGFVEWSRADGEQFGESRVGEFLLANAAAPSRELIGRLYDRLLEFVAGSPQADDLTAVVIKKL